MKRSIISSLVSGACKKYIDINNGFNDNDRKSLRNHINQHYNDLQCGIQKKKDTLANAKERNHTYTASYRYHYSLA